MFINVVGGGALLLLVLVLFASAPAALVVTGGAVVGVMLGLGYLTMRGAVLSCANGAPRRR